MLINKTETQVGICCIPSRVLRRYTDCTFSEKLPGYILQGDPLKPKKLLISFAETWLAGLHISDLGEQRSGSVSEYMCAY